jgi:hypothetical protein
MNYKTLIGAVVILVIGFGLGHYFFQPASFGSTPAGNTFNTAKQASIVVSLLNATSSILNSSGNDYYITAVKAGCENVGTSQTVFTGAGLAKLLLSVATTSTANPSAQGTNLIGQTTLTISTSTPQFVVASSTTSSGTTSIGSSVINNIWPTGSYITFTTNATNTAACTLGVDYFSS